MIGFVEIFKYFFTYFLSYFVLFIFDRGNHFTDENVLRQRYKIFGYGVPAILILASNIHFYLGHYDDVKLEFNCYRHRKYDFRIKMLTILLKENCSNFDKVDIDIFYNIVILICLFLDR